MVDRWLYSGFWKFWKQDEEIRIAVVLESERRVKPFGSPAAVLLHAAQR
jgi:hypothetical protein